ncbi:MAG: WbqC family protein [Cyclobacteriaceae bacterium]
MITRLGLDQSPYIFPNRMKRVAIIQSNYIPWKGYFDIIGVVDEFIIYDEVQYTKNDWRNRNKIKTSSGVQWITIPVYQRSLRQKISETEANSRKWGVKNWNTIKSNYGRAPFFSLFSSEFEEFYNTSNLMLISEINAFLLKKICMMIGITTKITNSADYFLQGDSTEKLISLCKQVDAQCYLSGPAAKNYLKEDLFLQEGIQVEWMDYTDYPEYPQLYPPFNHQVSIIDLILNTGPNSMNYMKCGKK